MKKTFNHNTLVRVTHVNEDTRLIFDEYESLLEESLYVESDENLLIVDIGKLYKLFIKEYGKCTGKVYIDVNGKSRQIGWCFLKRAKYTDCKETYLQSTWVVFETKKPATYDPVFI